MNFQKLLMIIALGGCSTLFSTDYYGYVTGAVNNYPNSTLYMKNTDKNPGLVNQNTGSTILAIKSGTGINNFDQYVFPWDRFGGKIYVWLVDNTTNKIVNAMKLYDKEDTFYFVSDTELKPSVQQQNKPRPKNWCSDFKANLVVGIIAKADGNLDFNFSCVAKPADSPSLAAKIGAGAVTAAAGSGG